MQPHYNFRALGKALAVAGVARNAGARPERQWSAG